MSFENSSSHTNEQTKPEITDEAIQQAQEGDLTLKKWTKINNVLKVLDFPDNQEEVLKKILEKQDNQTLIELATKSKEEILSFLYQEKMKDKVQVSNEETKKQNIENEAQQEKIRKNNQKYESIKNILPNSVFDSSNPEFKNLRENLDRFEVLQTGEDAIENIKINEQKAEILETIIAELKNPQVLPAIVKELGWANKNNPKYAEFRDTLIGIDSSFLPVFNDLEKFERWNTFNIDEIAKWIEKNSGGMIEIDLKGSEAMSKRSLIGSNYSIDKAIDTEALNEIMWESQEELANLKNNFATLQEFGGSFDALRGGLSKIWWRPDFKENLKVLTQNFSKEVFDDLSDTYENMGIEWDKQLKEYDITGLTDINEPWDLEPKIKNVFEKVEHLQNEIESSEWALVKKYETEIKNILESNAEDEEKQLETLRFLRASGFDLLPKWISERIIREVKNNMLTIPWLNLAKENINLKNGNFGESGAFIDKEAWLNIGSKTNLVKFVNKVISGHVNEPLSVEAIANGTSMADPRFVQSQFLQAGLRGRVSWNYGKVVENLRKY